MKKTLAMLIATTACAASANVLLWLVDSTVASGIDDWNSAKIYQTTSATTPPDASTSTLLNFGVEDYAYTSVTKAQMEGLEGDYLLAANIGSVSASDTSTYFFIELYDSSNNAVGYSQILSASDLSNYIKDISDWSSMTSSDFGWNGGSFTAVPEPTSGLMMLLGMAMLGLRRKKMA